MLRNHAMQHGSALVNDPRFMAGLVELADAQEFVVDMLKQTVRQRELDQHLYFMNQSLADEKHKNAMDQKQDEIKRVEAARSRLEGELETVTARQEHAEKSLDNLLKAINAMPTECGNSNCSKEFSKVMLETKGHAGVDWVIRCRRCKCRIVG